MNATFNDLVENVRSLTLPEKMEIKSIVENSIIQEKRKKLRKNYLKAKKDYEENKLEFTSNIDKLKDMMK